jgi:hypothetical protein
LLKRAAQLAKDSQIFHSSSISSQHKALAVSAYILRECDFSASLSAQCHSFPAHVDSFWADLQLFTRNNSDLEKIRIHVLTPTDQHSIPIPGLEQSSTSSGRTMFGHHDDDEDTKDQTLARRGHGKGKLQVTSSFSFRDMARWL